MRLSSSWDPAGQKLSPAEGFLLSRVDGRTPWSELRQIGGVSAADVDAYLKRWLAEGIVVFCDGQVARSDPARTPAGDARSDASAGGRGGGVDRRIDASLDIDTDLQGRILDFEANLDRPYFDLLDIPTDSDAKEIKRAYFKLSKVYHPDRYFRRNLGDYKGRLDRIFKKLVEAYELLSDPATRMEVERSMLGMQPRPRPAPVSDAEEAPSTPSAKRRPPKRKLSKRETLERLRRHFKLPEKIMAERRFKASEFFKAAMVAAHKERWREAAPSLRLAIAFDPWNEEYRQRFAEIQARYHEQRLEEILAENEGAWTDGAQAEALRLIEEVLIYRPADAAMNQRAAELALGAGDLDGATEYAEQACELSPDSAAAHLALGRIQRRQKMREKAIETLKKAARLDPDDREIQGELRDIRRSRGRAAMSGGS